MHYIARMKITIHAKVEREISAIRTALFNCGVESVEIPTDPVLASCGYGFSCRASNSYMHHAIIVNGKLTLWIANRFIDIVPSKNLLISIVP